MLDFVQESMSGCHLERRGLQGPLRLHPYSQRPSRSLRGPEDDDTRDWAGMDHKGHRDWTQPAVGGSRETEQHHCGIGGADAENVKSS